MSKTVVEFKERNSMKTVRILALAAFIVGVAQAGIQDRIEYRLSTQNGQATTGGGGGGGARKPAQKDTRNADVKNPKKN